MSAPVPFGLIGSLNLLGLGWAGPGFIWDEEFGIELDNCWIYQYILFTMSAFNYIDSSSFFSVQRVMSVETFTE